QSALRGRHEKPVRSLPVNENAAVALRLSGGERAPFIFRSEPIVGIFGLGGEVALLFAADTERSIDELEDALRILVDAVVFGEHIEGIEVFGGKQLHALGYIRSGGQCDGECDHARYEQRTLWTAELKHAH